MAWAREADHGEVMRKSTTMTITQHHGDDAAMSISKGRTKVGISHHLYDEKFGKIGDLHPGRSPSHHTAFQRKSYLSRLRPHFWRVVFFSAFAYPSMAIRVFFYSYQMRCVVDDMDGYGH